jgi:hypothetical protein
LKSRKRTKEEIVQVINDYLSKFPNIDSRNKIAMATDISGKRLEALEKEGLIKLPPRIKAGSRTPWRFIRS